jgi:hypothetical protein
MSTAGAKYQAGSSDLRGSRPAKLAWPSCPPDTWKDTEASQCTAFLTVIFFFPHLHCMPCLHWTREVGEGAWFSLFMQVKQEWIEFRSSAGLLQPVTSGSCPSQHLISCHFSTDMHPKQLPSHVSEAFGAVPSHLDYLLLLDGLEALILSHKAQLRYRLVGQTSLGSPSSPRQSSLLSPFCYFCVGPSFLLLSF